MAAVLFALVQVCGQLEVCKKMLDLLVETFSMVSQSGATTTKVLWTTAQPENHYD